MLYLSAMILTGEFTLFAILVANEEPEAELLTSTFKDKQKKDEFLAFIKITTLFMPSGKSIFLPRY